MYVDHRRKESSNGPGKKPASTSERNSPSTSARDTLPGILGSGSGQQRTGFGRSTSTGPGARTSGSGVSPASQAAADRPPAGKPSRPTTGDFKSQSFGAGTSSLFSLGVGRRTSKPSPLDLGSSIPRSRVPSTFKGSATYSAGMVASTTRPKSAPTPQEYEFVYDDVTLTYGHSSFQGARDYQEDTVACITSPVGLAGGVFDGHGGDDISKELERVLLQNIKRKIAEATQRSPDDINSIQAAIHSAYTTTNEEIASRMDAAMEAGSCAVTAVVTRVGRQPYLFCANAGDCRAVLYTQLANGTRRAVRLSEDHKPHPNVCPSEITRICDAGGCVLWGRVQGCLAVSRAFGDRTLQPYVIADPHVHSRPLDPEQDQFFYLASDGVTDMVDDALGCQLIAEQFARGCNCTQAAAALVSAAYQKGSCDNISVLVVRVRKRQPGDGGGVSGA